MKKTNLRIMGTMVRHLEDDYETEQLNPVYTKNKKTGDDQYSQEDIAKAAEHIQEGSSLRLRVSFMEAVIDQVVEDAIDEDPNVTTEEIHEEVDPIIDKAVDLALIPSQVRKMVGTAINRHRKRRDPRMVFLEKCATFMTQSMTRMEEEQTTIDDETLDDSETMETDTITEEIKDDLSPETEHPNETSDAVVTSDTTEEIKEEEVKPEDVEVEAPLPVPAEASMKFLVSSTVNARKAKAMVIRNIAGTMSGYMFNELKYCLPEKFRRKYFK